MKKIRIWKCKVCNRLMAYDIVIKDDGMTTIDTTEDENLFVDHGCHHEGWEIYNNFTHTRMKKWTKEAH